MIQFTAHFDGQYLRPEQPVVLPEGVPLRVTIDELPAEPISEKRPTLKDLFDRLEAETGLIDGPPDWAAQHDHYLYGAAKRSNGPAE